MVHKDNIMFRSTDGSLFVYEGQPKRCPFCALLLSKSRKGESNEKEKNCENKTSKSDSRSFASYRKRVRCARTRSGNYGRSRERDNERTDSRAWKGGSFR